MPCPLSFNQPANERLLPDLYRTRSGNCFSDSWYQVSLSQRWSLKSILPWFPPILAQFCLRNHSEIKIRPSSTFFIPIIPFFSPIRRPYPPGRSPYGSERPEAGPGCFTAKSGKINCFYMDFDVLLFNCPDRLTLGSAFIMCSWPHKNQRPSAEPVLSRGLPHTPSSADGCWFTAWRTTCGKSK